MNFIDENFLIIAPVYILSAIVLTNCNFNFEDFFSIRDYSDLLLKIINSELYNIFNYNNVNNLKNIISEPENKLKFFEFLKTIVLDENLVNIIVNNLNDSVKESALILFENVKNCNYSYFEELDLEVNLKLIAQLINSIKEYTNK